MVSVVNGYVCFSSCDADAARQGKDPAAPPGSIPGASHDKTSEFDRRPAVMLDGALRDLTNALAVNRGSASDAAAEQQKVDLLI